MSSYIELREGIKKLRTQEDSPGGVSLAVERGKTVGLVGANRSGKISAVQNIVRLRKTG